MNNLSLRTRIFVSYFLLITLSLATVLAFSYNQILLVSEAVFFDAFDEKFLAIEGMFVDFYKEDVDFEDEIVYEELTELADDLDIAVALLEVDGEWVLLDTETERRDFPRPDSWHDVDEISVEEEPFFEDEEDHQVIRTIYLSFDDEPTAILRVSESLSAIDQFTNSRIVGLTIGTLSLGLFLWLILGSWLANALIRPLTGLRQSAQAMAEGKLDTRASLQTPSEIRLLANDFNQMAEAVEQMVAEQKAFASNAAHELRTPLTAMRIRTESLLEDNPSIQLQQQYIREIHDEIKQLGRLVGDLRLLSQSDAQRLVAGTDEIDLTAMLASFGRTFQGHFAQKSLMYMAHLPQESLFVRANPSHLQVIFRNVVENAVKYTPAGEAITLSLTKQTDHYQIKVVDTGMGIPPEDLPNIFKRFYRVDKAHNRKIPGSGLGLSLAQSIVELYQGNITIQSEGVSTGTTVTITLPIPTHLGE